MNIPDKFVYLLALIPFCLIWFFLFTKRKDLRKEIVSLSAFIGILSVITAYYWWTKDWWRPDNITGTIVGFEDFIMGFTTGGIMSAVYEFLFKKKYQQIGKKYNLIKACFIILFLVCLASWLIFVMGITSFWASTISLFLSIIFIIFIRRDLFFNSLISGIAMMFISIFFYMVIILISNTWINNTYLHGLSGFSVLTIPIEEFVLWFLAGMWVGPFYEFAFGKRLKKIKKSIPNNQ